MTWRDSRHFGVPHEGAPWAPFRHRSRRLDASVVVGIFGDADRWAKLAHERAVPSVPEGVPVHVVIRDTLAEARNDGAAMVDTEWLVFLDADDELEAGYLDVVGPQADVIIPRVRYIDEHGQPGHAGHLKVAGHYGERGHGGRCSTRCLDAGNFIVVGAPVRRAAFNAAGGFHTWPVYEDYDLWLRLHRNAARFAYASTPVYRAHHTPASRNQSLSAGERLAVEQAIRVGLTA